MSIRMPAPRLLPVTICVLASALAVRSTTLVRAIILAQPAALITVALASGAEEKPAPRHGAPTEPPKHGEPPAGPAKPAAEAKPPVIEGPPPVTDAERAVLLELRQRRQELEAREGTLAARESMLTAAEQKLSARVEELQGLQKKLESLDAGQRRQEDAAWQGLVKVYETMKPRDAAAIFNDLGMQVLLAVVDRMKEAKAAAILAAMAPDKAREVTMLLARSRSRTSGDGDNGARPPTPPAPGKAPG